MQGGLQRLKQKKHTIVIDGEEVELTRPRAATLASYLEKIAESTRDQLDEDGNPIEKSLSAESLMSQLDLIVDGIVLVLPEIEGDREFAEDLLIRSGGMRGELAGKMMELFGLGAGISIDKEAQEEASGPLAS